VKAKDGKSLEELAAAVERLYLPKGFNVVTRSMRFTDDGVPSNEFDIEIRGVLGTCAVHWVIECRDRPGSKKKEGRGWIEQLAFRKHENKLDKLIAVSSTGFSRPAKDLAAKEGIDLRIVDQVDAAEVAAWLPLGHRYIQRVATLLTFKAVAAKGTAPAVMAAIQSMLLAELQGVRFRSSKTGEVVEPSEAFRRAVDAKYKEVDKLLETAKLDVIALAVEYGRDDHWITDTDAGPLAMRRIEFLGKVVDFRYDVPFRGARRYRKDGSMDALADTVSYGLNVPEIEGVPGYELQVDMHRLASGETVLGLTRKKKDADDATVAVRVTVDDPKQD
jgi:hypothetical protein